MSEHPSVSYSQYNEDIILRALFPDVKRGFYVDVGANDPELDSVTNVFYKMGWRGINIEPIKEYYERLRKDRPKDININCGVGSKNGHLKFREYKNIPGYSRLVSESESSDDKNGDYKEYDIPVRTLKDILSLAKTDKINFLKIDVEGAEYETIVGNDWQKHRPEVICIEANRKSNDWRPLLTNSGYKLFIDDGLNEYYVAKESLGRTKDFADRAIIITDSTLRYRTWEVLHRQDSLIKTLNQKVSEQGAQIETLSTELRRASSLTLKNVPLRRRLRRAAYGLTVDWIRFKKSK